MIDPDADSPNDYHAICLRTAARRMGIACRYVHGVYSPHYPDPSRWLNFTVSGQEYLFARGIVLARGRDPWGRLGLHINEDANLLIRDKTRLKSFLRERGFGVPAGGVFRRTDPALPDAFASFDGPVCVKPNQGTQGHLTFPGIRDRESYDAAVKRVAAAYQKVLVEESAPGPVIRFFFVRPDVVALKLSRPASVVGDGVSSLARLIDLKNAERDRRAVPGHHPITVDEDLRDVLTADGRSLADVPADGQRVFLRRTSNGATGADSIAVTTVDPSYSTVIAAACNAVPGLNVTAVDVVVRDPGEPARPDNYWILEMNRNPGVTPYHFPWRGEPQDVAGAILEFLKRGGGLPA